MVQFSSLNPQVVLGIAAHPDDLDFGTGGTMAAFARGGAAVHYLILTDGGKGSADPDITSAELIKIRRAEQRAALKIIGGQDVQFLAYPDGELEITLELKKQIVKVIRSVKPDVVVTMDPSMLYSAERGFINHPDHRAAGQAALDAVFPLARDHLTFPELLAAGFQPHITPHVLLINFETSNYFVDITGTFDQKMQAIAAHASQVSLSRVMRKRFKDIATSAGKKAGYQLAEAFVRIDLQ